MTITSHAMEQAEVLWGTSACLRFARSLSAQKRRGRPESPPSIKLLGTISRNCRRSPGGIRHPDPIDDYLPAHQADGLELIVQIDAGFHASANFDPLGGDQ